MMPPIVGDGQLNFQSLVVNDVYVVIVPPQTSLIQGFPTDGVGLIGPASRGALNTPLPTGDPTTLVRTFGQINASSNDLVTEALGAMKQGANNVWGVRVSDGTDTAAIGAGADTTGANLIVFNAASTGTWGNALTVTIGPASGNTATAAIQNAVVSGTWAAGNVAALVVGGTSITYTAITGDTPFTIASALAAKMNANATMAAKVNSTVAATSTTTATITMTAQLKGTAFNATTLANTGTTGGSVTVSNATFAGTANGGIAATGTQSYRVVVQSDVDAAEIFDNLSGIAGTGATSAVVAIINAITNGISGIRGPSALVTAQIAGSPGSGTLANQALACSGGTDGRAGVTGSTQVGVDGPVRTGMYSLRGIDIAQFGLAGCTDTTTWPAQLQFAKDENLVCVTAIATGTPSVTAVNTKAAGAIDDWHMVVVKDWFYLNDTVNKQIRLVSPIGAMLGKLGTLSPERSPGNKPLYGYLGTERTGFPSTSGAFKPGPPYSYAEIALLENAGIVFATLPSVGGQYLGFRHGLNASSDPTRNGINYSKLTPFLAKSIQKSLGFAVDEVHTPALRRRVKSAISQFLGSMADPGPGRSPMIGDVNGGPAYSIVCDESNNPANMVALGYMFVSVQVKYLSIVRFFVVNIEAGQSVTVQVRNSPVTQAAA